MDHLETAHEQELLSALAAGDEKVFTLIYHKYLTGLFHSLLKMVKNEQVALEITQEVFTRLWLKRDTLSIEHNLQAYLYRIAQNIVLDQFRKIKREEEVYKQYKKIATSAYNPVEERLNYRDTEHALEIALKTLSEQQRKVFELCRLEGKSYKEAAHELGISHHTVKEYLTKASKLVKEYLMGRQMLLIIVVLFFLS